MKKLLIVALCMAAPMVSFANTIEVGKNAVEKRVLKVFEDVEKVYTSKCHGESQGVRYTTTGIGNSPKAAAADCEKIIKEAMYAASFVQF